MRRARWIVASFVLVAGCRAVLGIESLEVVDGGGEGDGGGGDATLGDSGEPDAGSAPEAAIRDTGPTPDTAPPLPPQDAAPTNPDPACADAGAACNMCCRAGNNAEQLLEAYARDAGCVCGSGLCTSECTATFCAQPPTPPSMSGNCGPCIGQALSADGGACVAARQTCHDDPSCRPVLDCLYYCPPPEP